MSSIVKRISGNALVQLVQSDPAVAYRPEMHTIPPCLYPLRTPEAEKEYQELTQLFIRSGKLTLERHHQISEYALQVDAVHLGLTRGLVLRPSRFELLRRARKALKLHELEQPVTSAPIPRVNKFALCGFANRRCSPELLSASSPAANELQGFKSRQRPRRADQ